MTDELKLRKQWDRSVKAKQLYENELMQEYFQNVEKGIMDTYKVSDIEDSEAHRNCKIALMVLQKLKQQFVSTITTGDAAAKELTLKK